MKKVLTSPSSFAEIDKSPFELLHKEGYIITNNPFGRKLTEDEVIELAHDCIGIVAGVEPITSRVIDALPNLKCISRVGVGMDSVDVDYARGKGIVVVNTPDGPTLPVAELTLGLTMALLRKIPQAHKNLSEGIWKKETGNLLFGKTVGIVGLGRIGKKVAAIFRSLGNEVVGFDINPDNEWSSKMEVKILDLNELLSISDIISVHVPGSADKKPILGQRELNLIRKEAFLVNIARGGVVDERFLTELLIEKKIRGATIDVFDQEPYNGPLCKLDNVILTPHLGSYASEAKLLMEIDAVNNLLNVLKSI